MGKLDVALVAAVPDTPKLNLLDVAETPIYIVLSKDIPEAKLPELRLEDIRACDWILPAPHVNPHLHEMILGAAAEKGIAAPDVHHIMTAEEAPELILAHKGAAFLTRCGAWRIARGGLTMRPLAEERVKLVTKLATRADNRSRLINEFVRAVGRKLSSAHPPQQGRLPLAG